MQQTVIITPAPVFRIQYFKYDGKLLFQKRERSNLLERSNLYLVYYHLRSVPRQNQIIKSIRDWKFKSVLNDKTSRYLQISFLWFDLSTTKGCFRNLTTKFRKYFLRSTKHHTSDIKGLQSIALTFIPFLCTIYYVLYMYNFKH